MSHAGHVFDMINRLKQNRSQRPSSRDKFKGNNREAIYGDETIKPEKPNFKTVPEKELTAIKKQIKTRAQTDRKRRWVLNGIYIVFMAVALLIILVLLN